MTNNKDYRYDYAWLWRILWLSLACLFFLYLLAVQSLGGQHDYQITGQGVGVESFRIVGWPLTNYDSGGHFAYKYPLIQGDTKTVLISNSNLVTALSNSPPVRQWKPLTAWSKTPTGTVSFTGDYLLQSVRDVR